MGRVVRQGSFWASNLPKKRSGWPRSKKENGPFEVSFERPAGSVLLLLFGLAKHWHESPA